jgi:moderate conductance mechanosensitive channel
MLRSLIASLFIACFIYIPISGADDEAELRVEDVTPEMLASTLPPQDEVMIDDSAETDDAEQRKISPSLSVTKSAEKTKKASDPTLQQLIQTLENEPARQDLLTTLKALDKSGALEARQFVFVNMFLNIKTFIKSVVVELKTFVRTLAKKDTWAFKFNTALLKKIKQANGINILYILLAAFIAQIVIARAIKASLPPFFRGIDSNVNVQNGVRTAISLFIFLLVAHILKIYFIKSADMSTYTEEVIITLFMVQLGLVLLRLSIATNVLPVNPEYRTSLFSTFIAMLCLWGGYTYISHFISIDSQTIQVSQPLSQLFWGGMTIFAVWVIHYYRHVIDGMIFRKLPFAESRLLGGLQQVISGGLYYVIMISLTLTFFAWFTHNQNMFSYLRDQLLITMTVLCGLSVLTSLMVSSTGYLVSQPDQSVRMLNVTHRLIDILAFISVGYVLYRWIIPLLEMQGISTSKFSDKLLGIFLIIALTVLIFHGLNRLFNSSIPGIKDSKHLKTFLPIVDKLSKLLVFVIAMLLVLIELNVNVMPIVASFSVLGLGIGLASKSIIEDFINGLFIIQENDFNIGDMVTIASVTGAIENITLRKLHLRDGQGFLNVIPFSNIGTITNKSRGFNSEKVNIPLPSVFHLKRTVRILEDVGQQLLQDPDLKDYIVSAPKFIGISEFQLSSHPNAEVSTMMQFEIRTVPGKLVLIASEFRKLAKLAFEEMERIM